MSSISNQGRESRVKERARNRSRSHLLSAFYCTSFPFLKFLAMDDSSKHIDGQASKAKAEIGESSQSTLRNLPTPPSSTQTTSPPNNPGMRRIVLEDDNSRESLSRVKPLPQLSGSGSESKGPSRRLRSNSIAIPESKSVASPPRSRKGKNRAIKAPTAPQSYRYITRSVSNLLGLRSLPNLQERDSSLRTSSSERQSTASTSYTPKTPSQITVNIEATPSGSEEYLPVDLPEDEVIHSPLRSATNVSPEIPLSPGKRASMQSRVLVQLTNVFSHLKLRLPAKTLPITHHRDQPQMFHLKSHFLQVNELACNPEY
jgi:hypothetical protein